MNPSIAKMNTGMYQDTYMTLENDSIDQGYGHLKKIKSHRSKFGGAPNHTRYHSIGHESSRNPSS